MTHSAGLKNTATCIGWGWPQTQDNEHMTHMTHSAGLKNTQHASLGWAQEHTAIGWGLASNPGLSHRILFRSLGGKLPDFSPRL